MKELEPDKSSDSTRKQNKIKQYVETLNLMLDDTENSEPFQMTQQLFNKFTENIEMNENDSSDDDSEFSKKSNPSESDFFLSSESTNPCDPNNYLLINKKSRNGKIRTLIMCRATAQNMVDKAQEILKQNNIVNDKWTKDNAEELQRVQTEVAKARSRMKKGSEFRVLTKQYIRDKIKPKWNNWTATYATNDGGILYIFPISKIIQI